MDALRVVVHEEENKKMKMMDTEVRGVVCDNMLAGDERWKKRIKKKIRKKKVYVTDAIFGFYVFCLYVCVYGWVDVFGYRLISSKVELTISKANL